MLALARKIVSGEEDTGTVESVFAEAQQVAADAEALLVDEGWHAPGPVATDAVAVGAGTDDGRDDAGEAQRTLCSWAEWPGNRQNRSPGVGMKLRRSRCSSGRWSRSGKGN